jgi:hypothetical protein
MLLGKVAICLQKNETRSMPLTLTSINSKWIKDLNIRPEILKLVPERAGNTLEAIGIDNDFLSRTQMVQQLRERTNKWKYMKLKGFCTTKEVVSKVKMLPTEWENIFASYTSDKGLITRIYREFKKLNSPKISDPIKKWANELNRAFSKEEVQRKKLTSLATKEMQIKTILRFQLTTVRIATIKNTTKEISKMAVRVGNQK